MSQSYGYFSAISLRNFKHKLRKFLHFQRGLLAFGGGGLKLKLSVVWRRIGAFLRNSADDKESWRESKRLKAISVRSWVMAPTCRRKSCLEGAGGQDETWSSSPPQSARVPSKYERLSNINALIRVNVCVYMRRTRSEYRKLLGSWNKTASEFCFASSEEIRTSLHVTTSVPLTVFIKLFILSKYFFKEWEFHGNLMTSKCQICENNV
jgi:hypothetical protein